MGAIALSSVTVSAVTLPKPTGINPVGTLSTVLRDGTPVRFWYPAQMAGEGRRSTYRAEFADRTVRERILFPLVQTRSRDDLPVSAGPHPVVLYLPGWGETRSDNTALCEDLASHGIVVAALDDSRPRPQMDFADEAAFRRTLKWANTKVRLESRRVTRVLSLLQESNVSESAYSITGSIDFHRVAAVGYSFGGAVAAETAISDPRVHSAVNLDGWIFGMAAHQGVSKPFMIIGTGAASLDRIFDGREAVAPLVGFEGELDRTNSREIMTGLERNGGYYVTIDGTVHESFCDVGVLPRIHRVHGAIDGRRAQRIVVAYVNDFLSKELYGRVSPLLSEVASQPGRPTRSRMDEAVQLTMWVPPASVRRVSG